MTSRVLSTWWSLMVALTVPTAVQAEGLGAQASAPVISPADVQETGPQTDRMERRADPAEATPSSSSDDDNGRRTVGAPHPPGAELEPEVTRSPSSGLLAATALATGALGGVAAANGMVSMIGVGGIVWLSNASSAAPVKLPGVAEPLYQGFFVLMGLPLLAILPGLATGLALYFIDAGPVAIASGAVLTSLSVVAAVTATTLAIPLIALLTLSYGSRLHHLTPFWAQGPGGLLMLAVGTFFAGSTLVGAAAGLGGTLGAFAGQGADAVITSALEE